MHAKQKSQAKMNKIYVCMVCCLSPQNFFYFVLFSKLVSKIMVIILLKLHLAGMGGNNSVSPVEKQKSIRIL